MKHRLWLLKGIVLLLLGGCLLIKAPKQPTQEKPPEKPRPTRPEETPSTSLPSAEGSITSDLEPVIEPIPPEIGYYEAIRQLKIFFPSHLKPLTIKGRIPLLLHDLDRDIHPEGFSLGIPVQELDNSEINLLSDYSRLFNEDKKAVGFYLVFFKSNRGKFSQARTINLGKWYVYESILKTRLDKNKPNPIIIIVSFQTLDGHIRELFVFNDASGIPVYRTTLIETLSIQSKLEDIDGDGVLDLFIQEKGMEEGTGYETFLTLYRWNGTGFTEELSKNVVRNLKSFLSKIKELILAGDIHELILFSIDPKEIKTLKKKGFNDPAILAYFLGLDELEKAEIPRIRDVIFPEILEDPFTVKDEKGSSFRLSFRIIDQNGISYIANTLLYMLKNPFGEKQFVLSSIKGNF